MNELDNNADKNSGQACTICFEDYKDDRKQVAFGPCGHYSCGECFGFLPMVEVEAGRNGRRGRRSKLCPFCRAEIQTFILLYNN